MRVLTDGDRDFHIIIGDDEDINEAKPFMNAEISGLPSSGKNLQPFMMLGNNSWICFQVIILILNLNTLIHR